MNKLMTSLALTSAFIGMGIAMPQCPGSKAMQQQVDTIQAQNLTINQKLTQLESQVKAMAAEQNTNKQLMTQLASAITAQEDALDRMDAAVKDLQAKATAKPAAHAKSAGKAHKKGK